MSAAKFPFRLFKNGQEIVFPKGARRFIKCDTALVDGDGEVESTIYGGAVYTGSTAFRRHMVSLSCTDVTVAPLVGLWKGDVVTLHSPTEMAVPGSNVELPYDAVPGSVYGVDAEDTEVGRVAGGGRLVSIPGADVIRFRPVMKCMIVERSFDTEFGRGQAGWGLTLRDVDGFDGGDAESDALTVRLEPRLFPTSFDQGSSFSLDLAALTTVSEGGLTVAYILESGSALPPGVSRSGGLIQGTLTTPGLHVFAVRATALNAYGVQTYAVYVSAPASSAEVWATGTGGEVFDYTDADGVAWRSHRFTSSGLFGCSTEGEIEAEVGGGGGGGGAGAYGGGGGGSTLLRRALKLSPGSYTVVVGAGGARGTSPTIDGGDGNASSVFGIVSPGGGGGASRSANGARPGRAGASGGGAAIALTSAAVPGGAATAPPIAAQGFPGGPIVVGNGNAAGAGGGGAGGAGTQPYKPHETYLFGGDGGPGILSDFSGVPRWFGAGGGGGGRIGVFGFGGTGGGGDGGEFNSSDSTTFSLPKAGAVNSGAGGGGSGGNAAGTGGQGAPGGSGVVIIRYRTN